MPELKVAIISHDEDQGSVLKLMVDDTAIAGTVLLVFAFPVSGSDPVMRRLQETHPHVVLADVPVHDPAPALRGIELIHAELPGSAIFAIGDLKQPQQIVGAMRGGAREFIERPPSTTSLLDAFARMSSARRKVEATGTRGKVYTVVNAKGGSGATTVAVNCALSLVAHHRRVALVDLAPLGHAALHLNVKPTFTVADALRNLHRLDGALLDGFMTRCDGGLMLLAGNTEIAVGDSPTADYARLFDLLVTYQQYVVVDASSRVDAVTRVISELSEKVLLVTLADVASLWSADHVRRFLADGSHQDRVQLVLNRFRKIPGFSESEVERAAHAKILGRIPNQYAAVSGAIDRGVPVTQQNHSEVARAFVNLAASLGTRTLRPQQKGWSLFNH